ncbi:hypothetical protein M0802_001696 [Mischocyttarus mexicanus]|nr:hypothetical protein M0802_001696 [Mischocyttarus mexicanus]
MIDCGIDSKILTSSKFYDWKWLIDSYSIWEQVMNGWEDLWEAKQPRVNDRRKQRISPSSRTIFEIETIGISQNTARFPVSGLIKVFSGGTAGTTGTPGRQINRSGLPPYHLTLTINWFRHSPTILLAGYRSSVRGGGGGGGSGRVSTNDAHRGN